jgi:hypothetical protein
LVETSVQPTWILVRTVLEMECKNLSINAVAMLAT